ncbi:MAG: glycosyltransferase [bacterium]|nr:glycosyltransferase [bacterium]
MRILFVANKYLGSKPEFGHSYEYNNFLRCLAGMGHDLLHFDHAVLLKKTSRARMNRRLEEVVRAERPELLLAVPTDEELEKTVLRRITDRDWTNTLCWFCDDHHRFDAYSRHWTPCFHRVVTTAHSALPKYEAAGLTQVIFSQWACNPFFYRRLDLPLKYDLSFVGALHGNRREMLQALRDAGLSVAVWGLNAPAGPLSDEQMIEVFNRSRINLNFSGASVPVDLRPTAREQLVNAGRRLLGAVPVVGPWLRRIRARQRGRDLPRSQVDQALAVRYVPQIKGRNFEIPGCGGFQLTGRADHLEDYFSPGEEIVLFDDVDQLVDRARYYLRHEDERARIARAGHARCLREHTYVHRFNEIFRKMGLPASDVDPEAPPLRGAVEEIT